MKKTTLMTGFLILALIQAIYAEPRFDSVSLDPIYIEAGDTVNVYVKFHENPDMRDVLSAGSRGEGGAKTIAGDDPSIFYKTRLIPVGDISETYILVKEGERSVGHLFIGESWTSPFEIKIRENAPATTYSLEFQIIKTDIDGNDEELIIGNDVEILVRDSVEFDIESNNALEVGSTEDIEIGITNEGGGIARHVNVELTLDSPFTTATSSSKYLGNFEADETKDVEFSVSVGSGAEIKTHEIPLTITYIDSDGVSHTVKKEIGARIKAEPDLSIGLDEADSFAPGRKGTVTLGMANEGFVDAKFLKFKLLPSEYYQILSIDEIYIGNLDSDDVETEDMIIKVNDNAPAGEIPLRVELRYKGDGSNKDYVLSREVPLKVLTPGEYAAENPQQDKISTALMAVVAVPALILGVLLVWFIYKIIGLIMTKLNKKLFSKI